MEEDSLCLKRKGTEKETIIKTRRPILSLCFFRSVLFVTTWGERKVYGSQQSWLAELHRLLAFSEGRRRERGHCREAVRYIIASLLRRRRRGRKEKALVACVLPRKKEKRLTVVKGLSVTVGFLRCPGRNWEWCKEKSRTGRKRNEEGDCLKTAFIGRFIK